MERKPHSSRNAQASSANQRSNRQRRARPVSGKGAAAKKHSSFRRGSPSTTVSPGASSSTSKRPASSISNSSLQFRHLPATISDALFDSVLLLIACRQHDQLLLTRGTKRFLPCAPLTMSGHHRQSTWEDTALAAARALVLCGQDQEEEEKEEVVAESEEPPDERMARRSAPKRPPPSFASFSLVHLLRVQLPQSERFITRLVFLATLDTSSSQDGEANMCRCSSPLAPDSPVRWYSLGEAVAGRLANLWGPEVAYFARLAKEEEATVGEETIQEYSLADAFMYKVPPLEGEEGGGEERAAQRELLAHSVVSLSDVERAYADFLEHAFPSFYLSRTSFLFYLARHNILTGGGQLATLGPRLFAAFHRGGGRRSPSYLSFPELLLGLAAIEGRTKNGRARLALVFRYYDADRDGLLSVAELRLLMEDLQQKSSEADKSGSSSSSGSPATPPISPSRLTTAQVTEEMVRLGGTVVTSCQGGKPVLALTQQAFLAAVLGSSKRPPGLLKGTSRLVRISTNPFAQITRSMAARALLKLSGSKASAARASEILAHRRYEGRCAGCTSGRKAPFELAANVVRLNRRGECIDWTPVAVQTGQATASTGADLLEQITFPASPSSSSSSSTSSAEASAGSSSSSKDNFRWLHHLHAKIRHHNSGPKGTREAPVGLYHGGHGEAFTRFYGVVKRLAREVGALLEAEDRVLKVAEPVYIVGDLHGNLADLLSIERCILRSSPHLTANYLFLGDYVDRGKWGFECFLYLAVAKLLNRSRVFLLRGNHEYRLTQEKYRFKEELTLKYGRPAGLKLWDLVNYVCDRLPVCAVVGGALFAAHGGIPTSLLDLPSIDALTPHVLPEPDRTAPWVWQMLWNDPMEWAHFLEAARLQKVAPSAANSTHMYLFNAKRGTAYVFNDYAVGAFLRANRLQYVIRAHEVPDQFGVRFNFGRLCTTIFSCSHYTNKLNNECSVILVGGEGRIRVLRIDTRLNKPAMM